MQGSSSAYGKSFTSKVSKLDLYDRGAGYDENDSFIDNTEAVRLISDLLSSMSNESFLF